MNTVELRPLTRLRGQLTQQRQCGYPSSHNQSRILNMQRSVSALSQVSKWLWINYGSYPKFSVKCSLKKLQIWSFLQVICYVRTCFQIFLASVFSDVNAYHCVSPQPHPIFSGTQCLSNYVTDDKNCINRNNFFLKKCILYLVYRECFMRDIFVWRVPPTRGTIFSSLSLFAWNGMVVVELANF